MENIIEVGLIKGRHEMPVNEYLFDGDIEDVFDYLNIRKHIINWINDNIHFQDDLDSFPTQTDAYDIGVIRSIETLVVYITGLTPVTVELINACYLKGVKLILMNYNKDTGKYVKQRVLTVS